MKTTEKYWHVSLLSHNCTGDLPDIERIFYQQAPDAETAARLAMASNPGFSLRAVSPLQDSEVEWDLSTEPPTWKLKEESDVCKSGCIPDGTRECTQTPQSSSPQDANSNTAPGAGNPQDEAQS